MPRWDDEQLAKGGASVNGEEELDHVSMFSGVAGIDIAAEAAGFHTTLQIEIADYQRAILCKHWPNVPKITDVRHVTREKLDELGITGATVLSGGFPCQPFSTAGKRKGKADDRYLWPEIIRIARLLKPTWIVGENVAGIVSMEQPEPIFAVERDGQKLPVHEKVVPEIIEELHKEGFLVPRYTNGTPVVFGVPASAVGACHKRERIFIVAYSENNRLERRRASERRKAEDPLGRVVRRGTESLGQDRADSDATYPYKGGCCSREPEGMRVQRCNEACHETGTSDQYDSHPAGERSGKLLLLQGEPGETHPDPLRSCQLPPYTDRGERSQQFYVSRARWIREQSTRAWEVPWPEAAAEFCGVVDGVPSRVDRIKSLGNAVVPAQIYPVFEAIAKIERGCMS